MDLLSAFKNYLFSQDKKPSKVTVKNYLSDVNHFVKWFELRYSKTFSPTEINKQTLESYKLDNAEVFSQSSFDRHFSSLRKFFYFLKIEGKIALSPFEQIKSEAAFDADPWHIKDFKSFLYVYNASHLTIKNYLIDIKQFLTWAEEVTGVNTLLNRQDKSVLNLITPKLIEEYKLRLLNQGSFSPATINRKLSSLRKYTLWAGEEGLLSPLELETPNIAIVEPKIKSLEANEPLFTQLNSHKNNKEYSKFPPLRLFQKVSKGISLAVDSALIAPIAKGVGKAELVFWHAKGKPIFEKAKQIRLPKQISHEDILGIKNISKEFYAPLEISTKNFTWYKKAWFNLRYYRPQWYKRYHSYAIVHYFHFAVLVIFVVGLAFGFYNGFVKSENQSPTLAAGPTAPPRVLSFQGRLTDNNDNQITAPTNLRFAIYDTLAATGSSLLWQEVDQVAPDSDGIFNVILGNTSTIPQSLFANNSALWLGVTVESTPELTPRQQLATVAYATNAEVLQGMPPTTQAGLSTFTNTVLALDGTTASPTLTIGGSVGTTFQATGGTFKISGQPLLLTTNVGTNGNVQIAPDGTGRIDLVKPLINTSLSTNIPSAVGSVEVDDSFAILASQSGQSALTINETGGATSPLISASASGVSKFTVDNSGNIVSAGNLQINGGNITSNNTAITIDSGSANSVSLGSGDAFNLSGNFAQTGTTTFSTGTGLVSINGNINTNLIPNSTSVNLGSATNYWGSLYANNIYPSTTSTIQGFLQRNNGALSPTNITDDFLFGGLSTSSALFRITGGNKFTGTSPVASISANTTYAALVVDNKNSGDLIVASSSAIGNNPQRTQFQVSGVGAVYTRIYYDLDNSSYYLDPAAAGLSLNLAGSASLSSALTFSAGAGNIQTTARNSLTLGGNTTGQVILSGFGGAVNGITFSGYNSCTLTTNSSGVVLCGTGGGSGNSPFAELLGAIVPNNSTEDFLIGSQATSTAEFAFTGLSSPLHQTQASFSGQFIVMPNNGYGLVGIGTTNPTANLQVNSSLNNTSFKVVNSSASEIFNVINNTGAVGVWNQIYSTQNSTLNIFPDQSNGITILSGGNVGIKNTSPLVPLDVIGAASASGSLTFKTGAASIQATADNTLTIGGNTTGQVVLSGFNGAVNGITFAGYTTAGCTLKTTTAGVVICGTDNGGTNWWNELAGALSPININDDFLLGSTATSTAEFSFTGVTTGQTIASISGSLIVMPNNGYGNVGIGLTNPSARLQIKGGSAASSYELARFTTGDGGGSGYIAFTYGSGGGTNNGARIGTTIQSGGGGDLQFQTAPTFSGAYTTKLELTREGLVGIGTAIPTALLHINGGYSNNAALIVNNLNSGDLITASASGATKFNVSNAGVINNVSTAQLSWANFSNTAPTIQAGDSQYGLSSSGNYTYLWSAGTAGAGGFIFKSGSTELARFNYSGTLANTLLSGNTSFATLVANNTGVGDLFTASASGVNKFVVKNNGTLIAPNYTTCTLKTDANGLFTCGVDNGGTNWWNELGGVLSPINITDDFAIGGTATSTAEFSFTGVKTGQTIASVSGNLIVMANNGWGGKVGIGTTNPVAMLDVYKTGTNQPLAQVGGPGVTDSLTFKVYNGAGKVELFAAGGTDSFLTGTAQGDTGILYQSGKKFHIGVQNSAPTFTISNGTVGIGITSPTALLHINGGYANNAALIVNNLNSGDLFTASASGVTKFTVNNNGNLTFNQASAIQTNTGTLTLSPAANIIFSSITQFNNTNSSDITPTTDNSYNLGNSTHAWASLYTNLVQSNGANTLELLAGSTGKIQIDSQITTPTNANLTLAPNGTGVIQVNSNILPSATGTLDLGSTTGPKYFRNIYGTTYYSGGTVGVTTSLGCVSSTLGIVTGSGLCPGSTNWWNELAGALSPINLNDDLLIGGTATSAAEFSFTGLGLANHQTQASISGQLIVMANNGWGGNASLSGQLVLGAFSNPTIQTTRNQGLTIGGDTTGPVTLKSYNSTVFQTVKTFDLTNIFIGLTTGNQTLTGRHNYIFGDNSGTALTTGSSNNIIGNSAGPNITTGIDNVLVGDQTGNSGSFNGDNNTLVGALAGPSLAGSSENACFGYNSCAGISGTSSFNTFIGGDSWGTAGITNSVGLGFNTAVNASNATAIGANATVNQANSLVLGGSGANSVKVGIGTPTPLVTFDVRGNSGTLAVASVSGKTSFASLVTNNDGVGDLFTASQSSWTRFVIQGNGNTGIGVSNPDNLLQVANLIDFDPNGNTMLGYQALGNNVQSNTYNTTAVGYQASYNDQSSGPNTSFGYQANMNATGGDAVAIGYQAGKGQRGGLSVAIGDNALSKGGATGQNTAVGYWSQAYSTNGFSNTSLGRYSLEGNTFGNYNTALGDLSLSYTAYASYSSVLGSNVNFAVPSNAMTATAVAGAGLGIGNYGYKVTYLFGSNETDSNTSYAFAFTSTGNQQVNLASIPTGPSGTTARKIYRIKLNGDVTFGRYYLVTTINDNTTTTYSDTTADASLGVPLASPQSVIALGAYAAPYFSNQMIAGSDNAPINNIYLGRGYLSATPSDISLNATGGNGTNIAGANLVLNGGASSGNAAGGAIIFQTTPLGASGASPNSLVEAMRITSGGLVGIGTNSPTSPLHINDGYANNAALTVNNLNSGDLFTASASGATKFSITNAGGIKLGTNQGSVNNCLLSGGTGAAATWNTCPGGGTNWWNQLGGVLSPVDVGYDLAIGGNSTASALFSFTGVKNTLHQTIASISGQLVVAPNNGYGGNIVPAIDNKQNLGASPSARWKSLFLGPGSLHIQCQTTDAGCPASQNIDWQMAIDSNGTLGVGANVGGVNNADLFINSNNGNVGIGTTNIPAKLSLAINGAAGDTANYGNGIQITNAATGGQQIAFVRAGNWVTSLGYLPSSNFFGFGHGLSTDASFTPNFIGFDTNGNVGVGTTSPVSKLDLQGQIIGKALVNFNYTGTDQNILTASASGATQFYLTNAGAAYTRAFYDLDNPSYFLDPAASTTSLTTAGNVGVGITGPSVPLEVNGIIQSDRTGVPTQYVQLNGGDSGSIYLEAGSPITNKKPFYIDNTYYSTGTPAGNNNIYFRTGISTGPSTWMSIFDTGRVSIGGVGLNTAPELQVISPTTTGQVRVAYFGDNASPATHALVVGYDYTNSLGWISGLNEGVAWQGLELAPNGGNVGINVVPTQKLTVGTAGSAGSSFYSIGTDTIGVNSSLYSYGLICAGNNSGACNSTGGIVIQGSGSNVYGNVYLSGSGTSYLNGGNVGVGTTSPRAKLDIAGTASTSGALSFYPSSATQYVNVLNGADLTFRASPGGDAGVVDRATITNEGEIISNTNAPSGGNFRAVSGSYGTIVRNDGASTYVLLTASGSPLGTWNTLRPLTITNSSGLVNLGGVLYVENAGQVGIGTSAPTYPLHVASQNSQTVTGYARQWYTATVLNTSVSSGSFTDNFSAYFTGDINVNGSVVYTSDQRLKNFIQDVPSSYALDMVNRLQAVQFTWKPEAHQGSIPRVGFFAQQVLPYVPEAVSQSPDILPDQYHLDYNTLTAFSIAAIQGLSQKVDATSSSYLANLKISDTNVIIAPDPNMPNGDYKITDANNNVITQMAQLAKLFAANINAGLINVQTLTANALNITTENITINGQNIRDYIASIVQNIISNTNNNIISPIASVDQLHTDLISPIATSSAIALKLDNSKFEILNSKYSTGSAVSSFDNAGNATLSGTLAAKGVQSSELNVSNDATISGTLHAGRILASDIEGLNIQASTVSAQYITNNVTNIYNSTGSSFPTFTATPANSGSSSGLFANLFGGNAYVNIASYSSQLAYIDNLNASTATFGQGLMVFGPTSLSDTSIVGQLSVNGTLILANNSINVLGSDLNLQPLRQGGLSIMGGLIYIDTNGNVKFGSDATVNGTLYAGKISPTTGDLTLSLASSSGNLNPNFKIQNAQGDSVLGLNQAGDLIASGEATFSKLNLSSLVAPALAVSPTEIVATGSAGTATINMGKTQMTINNKLVTDKSLIYITPKSSTIQTLFLLRQVPGTSFTVGIQNPTPTPIEFNWIIVN